MMNCHKCDNQFDPDTRISKSYKGWCDTCSRLRNWGGSIRRRYGITFAEYGAIIEQATNCSICGVQLDKGVHSNRPVLDHRHDVGVGDPMRIRGVLCNNCNTGLGSFKDDIASLEAAIEYLKEQAPFAIPVVENTYSADHSLEVRRRSSRICNVCKIEKPLSDFYRKLWRCKTCDYKLRRERLLKKKTPNGGSPTGSP